MTEDCLWNCQLICNSFSKLDEGYITDFFRSSSSDSLRDIVFHTDGQKDRYGYIDTSVVADLEHFRLT